MDQYNKILVLDDEPEMLSMMSQFLKGAGYQVLIAVDGEIGLQMIYDKAPDLILTDIQMPKVDGWVVCNKVKEDQKLKHIPIIMFSGLLTVDSEADKAIEKCDFLMAKPIKMKVLLEKIKELLKSS